MMALNNGRIIFVQNFTPTELSNPWLSNHLNLNIEKIVQGCLTEVSVGENIFLSHCHHIQGDFFTATHPQKS